MKALKRYLDKFIFSLKQVFCASPVAFLGSVLAMIISGTNSIIITFFTAKIVNDLTQVNSSIHHSQKLIFMVLTITGSTALNFFSSSIKSSFADILGCRLSNNIENIISEKSQKISHAIMDKPDFLNLYRNTVDKVGYEPINILYSFLGIISSIVGLLGHFIILYSFSWFAPIIFLLIYIPVYFLRRYVQFKDYDFSKKTTMLIRQIWYHFSLMSEKKYAKEIRTYHLFPFLKQSKNSLFEKFMKDRNKILAHNMISVIITTILIMLAPTIVEIKIILSVIKGMISVSQFVLLNGAVVSSVLGIISLTDLFITNNRSMLFLDFLFEFLDLAEEDMPLINLPKADRYVFEFKNVSFRYPGASSFCLRDINFTFHTGQKICLVGENGSGKSTLVKLLLRIYKPSEGQILINGTDILTYNLDSYLKIFSVVFQDYINFSLNIKKCIGFGDVNKLNNLNRIIEISKKTGADNFIKKYKNGYGTNLSRDFYCDGIEPSIGQWQRLAISRGFYADAPVLIMDEPTASVDPKAEEEIFRALSKYGKDKTAFIISHRMSSAKLSDKIILLDNGQICENGSHSKLMKNKKKYFNMYSLQAKKYAEI